MPFPLFSFILHNESVYESYIVESLERGQSNCYLVFLKKK